MSEEKSIGVECKNEDCNYGIVLGDRPPNPQHGGDIITFVNMPPRQIKCPACGREYEYTQADLRKFPKDAS